ncbi:hypothetical protein DV515_00002868, partial [Chloebia gouldiae]
MTAMLAGISSGDLEARENRHIRNILGNTDNCAGVLGTEGGTKHERVVGEQISSTCNRKATQEAVAAWMCEGKSCSPLWSVVLPDGIPTPSNPKALFYLPKIIPDSQLFRSFRNP